ncbi:MAG: Pyridoxal phosphate-dependent enzyme [uncultured bacterium]|nr:MAG: Pyridoxal phosphate-dependent enzyme [uncultured bacterium]
MLGLKTVLLLRINEQPVIEGNYFLDKLFGAEVRFCTPDEYRNSRDDIMAGIAKEIDAKGRKCYIIPEGASNGLGSMGYYGAMEEICEQERESGINFEIVVVPVGSGGTYSGLCIANKALKLNKRVIGFAVCDDSPYFTNRIDKINHEAERIIGKDWDLSFSDIEINDKYVGIGYAISRPEELTFISEIASREALVLDPVYTGKAMYGLYNEIIEGRIAKGSTILFIHTGGLFGLFPKQNQFSFI